VLLLLLPVLVVVAGMAAWVIDSGRSDGEVARGVEVAGVDLAGRDRGQVESLADQLSSQLAASPVVLRAGDQTLDTTAGALGATVDARALSDEALDARRGGFPLARPFRWFAGLFDTIQLTVPYHLDDATARAEVARLAATLSRPTEPTLQVADGKVQVVAGSDGQTVDPDEVLAELPAALRSGPPYQLDVTPVPLPPATDVAALQAVADEASTAVSKPLTVVVEGQRVAVPPEELLSWIVLDPAASTQTWTLDATAAINALRPRFPGLGTPAQQPHFDVVEGKPVIVPAVGRVVCCAPDSGARMASALRAGEEEVTLQAVPEPTNDGVAELQALGIVQQVSTFTTNHACCEGRVRNIQRFADLVRGSIIRPGERFSLNDAVGERTAAKGFVPAGAILDGVLEPQVGGGVSQFATTFFNASFFAGLDFVEYQAHSIYFSRYPRGREATISWPAPDLVVQNTTPYGILVWPTYTETSITVTFYSTANVTVQDLGRTEKAQGKCTRVTTTRQRTWSDGRTDTDTVFATYRPDEGLDCSGNPTNRARQP
jgi:vancomycin resistance protein YoaR